MIEVFYPNGDRPEKQPDEFVELDMYLEAKSLLGEEVPTLQELASQLSIGEGKLKEWLNNGEMFRKGLTTLKKRLDENLVTSDPWANRADVMLVRLLLLETEGRHNKPQDE
jgi:hypothetical protein